MKAISVNRIKGKRTVIAVNFSEQRLERLKSVLGDSVKIIPNDDLYLSPDVVLARNISIGDDPYKYPLSDDEMLLFCDFDGSSLNRYLDRLKWRKMDIPLKAVYNQTNKDWCFSHLLSELAEEHERLSEKSEKNNG